MEQTAPGVLCEASSLPRWVSKADLSRCLPAKRDSWLGQGVTAPLGSTNGQWHLDEVFVSIAGWQMYLWRAVDDEGEVLDVLVQATRDKAQHCA
jgi:transposase-like protein